MRGCDQGICNQPATTIGSFTDHVHIESTRGACSEEHRLEVNADLEGRGFKMTWKTFQQ